jgi:hypothetical protein
MDFGLWMEHYSPSTNWKKKIKQINDYKLEKPFSLGLYLIQKHLDYHVPRELLTIFFYTDLLEIERIETTWSKAESDKRRGGRLQKVAKRIGQQKGFYSKLVLFYKEVAQFSEPNLGEYPRIISFPPTFVFANLTCKAITYLLVKPIEHWLNKKKKPHVTNGQMQ